MTGNARCCLSYWFPKLLEAGIPVPRTVIYRTTTDLTPLCDGKEPERWDEFLRLLGAAADSLGSWPIFLRTGQGSGKHQWKDTCFVPNREALANHIASLVEWSHMVDFFGLPHDVWCAREMLPVSPVVTLPMYGDMPLVTEVRVFVQGGRIACSHDYWPLGAIKEGLPRTIDAHKIAKQLSNAAATSVEQRLAAHEIARKVAAVFADDGAWSVDLLLTDRGWYVTDMATAGESYHEPSCPNAKGFAVIKKGAE